MNLLKNHTKGSGFTIIEVMIVLAIAAVIMLIVFLAVPALQRNSRNNQRNSDGSRIAAAVSECLANRNGVTTSCDSDAEIEQGQMNQLTALNLGGTGSTSAASLVYNQQCNADGSAAGGAGPSTRSFIILYQLEPAVGRCIAS